MLLMLCRQKKCSAELTHTKVMTTEFTHLSSDLKAEEQALVSSAKVAAQLMNLAGGKVLNRFAIAEKDGIRGYSSGIGTTCTRTEAREREKRTKLLRIERQIQTR
jgi:hypothetical protein